MIAGMGSGLRCGLVVAMSLAACSPAATSPVVEEIVFPSQGAQDASPKARARIASPAKSPRLWSIRLVALCIRSIGGSLCCLARSERGFEHLPERRIPYRLWFFDLALRVVDIELGRLVRCRPLPFVAVEVGELGEEHREPTPLVAVPACIHLFELSQGVRSSWVESEDSGELEDPSIHLGGLESSSSSAIASLIFSLISGLSI